MLILFIEPGLVGAVFVGLVAGLVGYFLRVKPSV